MKFSDLLLFICLFEGITYARSYPSFDVVMRGGDLINELDEGDFPKYRNDKCTVRFPRNGNWATKNGFNTGGWDANQNSQCNNNSPSTAMSYKLQKDGNFVAYCGAYLDYSTHTGQGTNGDYFLAIDDDCVLHLYQGTFDCDSISIDKELWTNIRNEPLKNGDRLGQGEIVRDNDAGTQLIMQSSDGNLVLYGPYTNDNVLWAANQEWDGPPASDMQEHYARVAHNGHLTLVGKNFQYGDETVYFDKDLHSGGASCFTVEYDENEEDLVAVSCDGGRRRDRKLRGKSI